MPALGKADVVFRIARPVGGAADGALAVADLDQVEDGVTGRRIAGIGIERAEGRAGVVELGDDRSVVNGLGLHALGDRLAVNVETLVRVDHQVVIQVHTGIAVGLLVQLGVVTGDRAVCIEGVGVAGAAGPRHLVAVSRDEVGGLRVVLGCGRLRLFPLGRRADLGQAAQIIVAGGGGGVGGVEIVGVVGDDQEVHVLCLHGVLISILQRTGAVGILRRVGVDLTEVEAHALFADEERPGHLRDLAVCTGDREGDGVAVVGHLIGGLVADLAVGHGGLHGNAVDRHDDRRVRAAVGDHGSDLRLLVVLGRRIGQRRDGDDHRLVVDRDRRGFAVFHAVLVLRVDRDGQGGLAGKLRARDGDGVLLVAQLGVGDVLRSAAVDAEARLEVGELGQLVDDEGEGVVHAEVRITGGDGDGRVEDEAEAVGIGHGDELHGEQVGRAVEGPAAERVAEILDADGVAAVLGGLVIHDVAAGALLESPEGVVALRLFEEERLGVGDLSVDLLVLRAAQVLRRAVLGDGEGVVAAGLGHGEDGSAVAGDQLAVRIHSRVDRVDGRGDRVVGLHTEAGSAVFIINDILRAGDGQVAGFSLGADIAVAVGIGRGLVDRPELQGVDLGDLVVLAERPRLEGVVVLDVDLILVVVLHFGVGDRIAAELGDLADVPLRARDGGVLQGQLLSGVGGEIFAATGDVIGAVGVFRQLIDAGALSCAQVFSRNCTDGAAVGAACEYAGGGGAVNHNGLSVCGNRI